MPLTRALGAISGTSMDAIDVAVVTTDGERVSAFGPARAYPYPPALREQLGALIADPVRSAEAPLDALEAAVTDAFAAAIRAFLDETGERVDLVGLHGQTVFHSPQRRLTRQLGDGARLAAALRLDVVNRFRHADVAAGGEGAPLVPLYHASLAGELERPLMVLNLGGVANVTWLGASGDILAFDTGPASAMIDDFVRRRCGIPYDEGGAIARRGRVNRDLVAAALADPYFARPAPKSLDRNAFHALLAAVEPLADADAVATLTAFTVAATALAAGQVPEAPARWLAAGGGRHNRAILDGLAGAMGVPVEPVETVGWDGDALEAQCFGFLAVRSRLGLPLSLPGTTGVPAPMTGGDYWPGR